MKQNTVFEQEYICLCHQVSYARKRIKIDRREIKNNDKLFPEQN